MIIIDNRKSIVIKAIKAGFEGIHGDYFYEALKIPRHVLCSASNPYFTFAGGVDKELSNNFPLYCEEKQSKGGGNERIGNVCFTISVNKRLDSNAQLVREALQFAKDNTFEGETLCLCALGTSIGNLDEDVFISLLKEVFN